MCQVADLGFVIRHLMDQDLGHFWSELSGIIPVSNYAVIIQLASLLGASRPGANGNH